MRSVAIWPGWTWLSVTPSRGALAGQHLEGGDEARAVGVGELERVDRLADRHRADRDDAAEAALAHARQQPLEERHRREHERAVGGLPLLAA